jgi:hypothetical protein
MAYFYFNQLYFNVDATAVLNHLKESAAEEGIELTPTDYRSEIGNRLLAIGRPRRDGGVTTFHFPTPRNLAWLSHSARQFVKLHNVVVLELNYLEDYWSAILWEGDAMLDHFSTLPHQQELEPSDWELLKGNPELVARLCGVPLETVTPYYRWWQAPYDTWSELGTKSARARKSRPPMLSGKAIEGDVYTYGQAGQVYDFSQRLGGCGHVDIGPEWSIFECVRRQ